MVLKTIIFDFDDTLIFSTQQHVESFKSAANKYGLSINEKEITKLFGKPVLEILKQVFPDINTSQLEKIKDEKEKRYEEIIQEKKPKLLKGVTQLLQYLSKHDFNIGILSSDSIVNIKLILEKNKISNYFDKIMGSEDSKSHKPQPNGLLKIAKKMKSRADECIYIGDSKYDMMAACNANMIGIGVATGHYSKTELKSQGASIVFDDLTEVFEFMESSKILDQCIRLK